MKNLLSLLKEVDNHFSISNTFQEGVALAYYTVFSILPMIMIVISIFGIIWGEAAVSGEVYHGLSNTLGENTAQQIQEMISNQHKQHRNTVTVMIGFATLAFGATGMFNQLHSAYNNIWGIAAEPKSSLLVYYTSQILFLGTSFLYVLGEKLGLKITASEDAVLVVKQEIDQ